MSIEKSASNPPKTTEYIPSGKKFNGLKIIYSKDKIDNLVSEISWLERWALSKRLEKYREIDLWRTTINSINTFEMIALYQRAMTLTDSTTRITGYFNAEMHTKLKTYQEARGIKIDGLPGKETTKKILQDLESNLDIFRNVKPDKESIEKILPQVTRELWLNNIFIFPLLPQDSETETINYSNILKCIRALHSNKIIPVQKNGDPFFGWTIFFGKETKISTRGHITINHTIDPSKAIQKISEEIEKYKSSHFIRNKSVS